MTKTELARLAAAIAVLRPDWPEPSLRTFLDRHLTHRPLHDVAVALVHVATDPDTTTPARVLEAGPWWHAAATTDVPTTRNDCPVHATGDVTIPTRIDPRTGERVCAGCHADRRAGESSVMRDRGGRPIPDDARAQMLTAIGGTRA